MNWITNVPQAAKALRKADAQYAKAREAAKALPLAQKIIALREAKEALHGAYAQAIDYEARLRIASAIKPSIKEIEANQKENDTCK